MKNRAFTNRPRKQKCGVALRSGDALILTATEVCVQFAHVVTPDCSESFDRFIIIYQRRTSSWSKAHRQPRIGDLHRTNVNI